MELRELIHKALSWLNSDRCPFCTDPDSTDTYITYKGASNSSTTLRAIMNRPAALTTRQSSARPKDGAAGRQAEDQAQANPNPIFADHATLFPGLTGGPVGNYGDEAHHAISGNECMKGEDIEEVIKNTGHGTFEKDTGYSINNGANGVYLPSWHHGGRWDASAADGKWADQTDSTKYEIMKLAMKAGAGQAHIGAHEGKVTATHPRSYPDFVKGELEQIRQRVLLRLEQCPYCHVGGQPKRPAPAPYGVNQWLDVLSHSIAGHLKSHPRTWKYFVSAYAAQYHEELCRHGTLRQVLPDNWPPL